MGDEIPTDLVERVKLRIKMKLQVATAAEKAVKAGDILLPHLKEEWLRRAKGWREEASDFQTLLDLHEGSVPFKDE